ncbi:tetratricopeptide repeat protein [uncultured Shewanella sp.]|uniref:tetratricopeptide repeat protein n=1 Tax=uncultured Shewanella sp. TaxID=173975 RepID=UPI0026104E32|nr:tetratricopeptide repeat protein [uncultured Shewanella sp.]
MDSVIQAAIKLRESGQYQQSRSLLNELLLKSQYCALAELHIAWSYDNEGNEKCAIEYYSRALEGQLSATQRFDALFGLASTHRALGHYTYALRYFEIINTEYPHEIASKPFYAMCLYNMGRHKEAMSLLLQLLLSTTNENDIKRYQRAIRLYARDLDKIWCDKA